MKHRIILMLLTFSLFACREHLKEDSLVSQAALIPKEVDIQKKLTPEATAIDTGAEKSKYPANTVHLKFVEFELVIDSLDVWDEEEKLKTIHNDTAVVYMELGESIEGRKAQIKNVKQGNLRIYQRFENSVTIMNEGPHCDLTEWKHYDSEWVPLPIKDGVFITKSYSEQDWVKFIEVDMDQLRVAVRKQCGDFWADHIKNVKSPWEYPSGVSTSRIFLKVEWEDVATGMIQERIISFEIPMGC